MSINNLSIVFMGTPEFAVESLKRLLENDYPVKAVVTASDKPAGRGKKIQESDVKEYATRSGLKVLQPQKLKDPSFISTLKELQPDVFVVVAFRMLPKIVWEIPKYGTFNLHASLLPYYRGAAPINWAIINGERETGVTTFFINDDIDTGEIILQHKTLITSEDDAGSLHDKLMDQGADLVLKTLQLIESGNYRLTRQRELTGEEQELKSAPKITKQDCSINWNQQLDVLYNFIRGLSPYPAAWSYITDGDHRISMKIYKADKIKEDHSYQAGEILTDNKNHIHVAVKGGFIKILEIKAEGKKRMNVRDFLMGFRDIARYHFES